jgi:hypothetical protein
MFHKSAARNCYIIAGPNGGRNSLAKMVFRLCRSHLDTLHFFDNSSDTPRLIFKDEAGHTAISDALRYDELRQVLHHE